MTHFGIDYGSKLAGTTAIAFNEGEKIKILSSEKKKDADKFISEQLIRLKPNMVFIDAPLSLPAAYYKKGVDFHYRICDREAKAMSPMFLGGLTARAISLAHKMDTFEFIETYPSLVIQKLFPKQKFYFKKEPLNPSAIQKIKQRLSSNDIQEPKNWHEFDALLAWYSGNRYLNQDHESLGDVEEGQIIY